MTLPVIQRDLAEITGRNFLDYAMSVITDRALPDARDGLKPVQRRILYAMYDVGNTYLKGYKKSAKTVGEVLGKYHPHGDSSVYEAMVTMAQNFGIRNVLVDGHGNWGSVDGDPAAAMRYTEARLSPIGTEMLRDINKNTVDFRPNYDGEEQEPVVLPTLIPNLLANGVTGIAVGMATSIPPHNLGELYDALDYMLEQGIKGEAPDSNAILQIVKGPDFPTGAQIIGLSTVRDGYRTGRGKVMMRSKYEIEEHKGYSWIVITELPYKVNKARLVERIDKLRKEDIISGIKEIRDESDREGIRVVIELKKDASPQLTINKLLKHTDMQTSLGMNHVCLVDGQPQTLSIDRMLEIFLLHAAEVVYRRIQFDLDKAAARAHIIAGILAAIDRSTEVIDLIKESDTDADAISGISTLLGTDEIQSEAILDLRIRRLSQQAITKLVQENEALNANIDEYNAILNSESLLLERLRGEFADTKERYATPRKTEIVLEEGSIEEVDLVQEEMLIVTYSSDGLIKSVPEKEYRTQNRGTKGAKTATVKEDEVIRYLLTVNSKDDLMFFTNQGRCHTLKAFKVQKSTRTGRGKSINNYLTLAENESVVMMLSTDLSSKENDLLFVTRQGIIKRLALSDLSVRMSVTKVIGFKEGDELITAAIVSNDDQVMITTAKGQAIRIAMNEEGNGQIRQMGRGAAGIRGINIVGDDYVVDMTKVEDNGTIFTISQTGLGKRTKVSEYSKQGRGGRGVVTHKLNERTGLLVSGMSVQDDDELFIATQQGLVIRIDVSVISTMGRSTSGVKVMNLNEGDRIVSISKGAREEEIQNLLAESAPNESDSQADARAASSLPAS